MNKTFFEGKLNELQAQNVELERKLDTEKRRRTDAETALLFYANPLSYDSRRNQITPNIVHQDLLMGDSFPSDNLPNTKVAGRRAREHFERYESASP